MLLSKLYYPVLAILSLSVFVPFLFGDGSVGLNGVILYALIDFVKYFISFFAVSYFLTGIYSNVFKSKNEINKLNNYVVFNLAILVLFNVLRNFMPGFPFFEIFLFNQTLFRAVIYRYFLLIKWQLAVRQYKKYLRIYLT